MTITLDLFIVVTSLLSLVIFLVLHFLVFRFFKTEAVLKAIMYVSGLTFICHGLVSLLLAFNTQPLLDQFGFFGMFVAFVLSSFLLLLLLFVYIVGVFGPYESSIRVRLIREVAAGPAEGSDLNRILQNYNPAVILQKRINRLLSSGELQGEGSYRIRNNQNIFFFLNRMTEVLKKSISKDVSQ